jgi:hypothetical protein
MGGCLCKLKCREDEELLTDFKNSKKMSLCKDYELGSIDENS